MIVADRPPVGPVVLEAVDHAMILVCQGTENAADRRPMARGATIRSVATRAARSGRRPMTNRQQLADSEIRLCGMAQGAELAAGLRPSSASTA